MDATDGHQLQKSLQVYISRYDEIILADIMGNEKNELVIGINGCDSTRNLKLRIFDIKSGEQTGIHFWPWFTGVWRRTF